MITESSFKEKADGYLERTSLEIVQVNIGNRCNQSCLHCHVNASPRGRRNMDWRTAAAVLDFLRAHPGLTLDITGGAPELNPNFRTIIRQAVETAGRILVRSNLTVMLEPGREDLIDFLAEHRVDIIASLPCYTEENVDGQRGEGVFEKSISVLGKLNRAGYGGAEELKLDLVYNPGGSVLPGEQTELERSYKKHLKKNFGVDFNNLLTITNAPIGRFKKRLEEENKLPRYVALLRRNFNPDTLPNIMCRNLISVDYKGFIYDCDFNRALGLKLTDDNNRPLHISSIRKEDLEGRAIMSDRHCFCCTAGGGSSCGGALL